MIGAGGWVTVLCMGIQSVSVRERFDPFCFCQDMLQEKPELPGPDVCHLW